MTTLPIWYGTQKELSDLLDAVSSNCACVYGARGVRINVCSAHHMLAHDQRALNGLLFVRRLLAPRLFRAEGLC